MCENKSGPRKKFQVNFAINAGFVSEFIDRKQFDISATRPHFCQGKLSHKFNHKLILLFFLKICSENLRGSQFIESSDKMW